MTKNNIETLTVKFSEVGRSICCDLCDIEPVVADKEWLRNGEWWRTIHCPSCGRESSGIVRGAVAPMQDRESVAEDISEAYVEGNMSEAALERSLNRLYGLDE